MMQTGDDARRQSAAGVALLAVLLLLAATPCRAQSGALNTIPESMGYGAANAGGTGRLPPDAPANRGLPDDGTDRAPLGLPGAVNTIPEGMGYGAANAGGTGKVPQWQYGAVGTLPLPGQSGGASTGALSGSGSGNVGSGGTEGAGSR